MSDEQWLTIKDPNEFGIWERRQITEGFLHGVSLPEICREVQGEGERKMPPRQHLPVPD